MDDEFLPIAADPQTCATQATQHTIMIVIEVM